MLTPGEAAYLRGMLAYIEERPGFDEWPDVTVLHIPEKEMVCVSDGTRAESAPIYDARLLSDMVHNEWPHIAAEIVRQALNPPAPDTEPLARPGNPIKPAPDPAHIGYLSGRCVAGFRGETGTNGDSMIAWVDLETTGLDPEHHEIIEIAIVVTRNDLTTVHKWSSKVAPRHIERATPDAISVSGYDAADWAGAPALEEVMPTVARLMRYNMPGGHNTKFDLGFIAAAARQCGMDPIPMHYHCIDTVSLAWPLTVIGEIDSLSLDALCRHFGVARPYPHRAAADVDATLAVARILMHRMNGAL